MMMWRSLSGRTICQAVDAVAARRAAKDKPGATDDFRPGTADRPLTAAPVATLAGGAGTRGSEQG